MKLTAFEKTRLLLGAAFTLILGMMALIFLILLLFGKTHTARVGALVLILGAAFLESVVLSFSWGPFRKWKTGYAAAAARFRGYSYAGFGKRILAGLIDGLLFAPLAVIPHFIKHHTPATVELFFWSTMFYYPYVVFCVYRYGQSLGKMAVGIKVFDSEGKPVTLAGSFKRSAMDLASGALFGAGHVAGLYALGADGMQGKSYHEIQLAISRLSPILMNATVFGLLVSLADNAWILCNGRKRAIHDFIAGTIVLQVRGKTEAVPTA